MKLSWLTLLFFAVAAVSCSPNAASAETTTSETLPTVSVAANPQPAGDVTIEELDAKYPDAEKAYFAGGCFWCTEAAFDRIQGVKDVWSGYTGGKEKNPTYRQVAYGETGHAESIVVYFDPEIVSYETLLDVFFVAHDPTQVNRQGPDIGAHYRSEIFYLNDGQKEAAEVKIEALNASGKFKKPIATKISKAGYFYVAEGYHQDYYEDTSNPNQGYVQNVSRPKVEKVMKTFADILKPEFKEKP